MSSIKLAAKNKKNNIQVPSINMQLSAELYATIQLFEWFSIHI